MRNRLMIPGNALCIVLASVLLSEHPRAYADVDQIFNAIFFQNPADLSLIEHAQLLGGNLLLNPTFKYYGSTRSGQGTAISNVNDFLPYILLDYRVSDKWVVGFNITPSSYGNIDWPSNSIVAADATVTNVLSYRYSIQTSYQLTDKLTIGAGANLEATQHYELDYVVPEMGGGEELNNITGIDYVFDVGIFYHITPKYTVYAAYYSPINNRLGYGKSIYNSTVNPDLSLNITGAAVAFVGAQQDWTARWFLEEKVYWSGWSIQKNIYFTNTTTGSFVVPTNWHDTWSFQINTRYKTIDMVALLGSVIYETSAADPATNAIGYPLAPVWGVAAGFDVAISKPLSIQLMFTYGEFVEDAQISFQASQGVVSNHTTGGLMQFTYKL